MQDNPILTPRECAADNARTALCVRFGGRLFPRCLPDTGEVHGPERPAIIAHRYWCPSCDAQPAEPCRLSPRFTQKWSHEARHRVAQRALWRELMREYDIRIAR